MDDQLKSNLTSGEHWTRFIYMLLFSIFLYIASFLAVATVVIQFVFALITGAPNLRLRGFGGEVVAYINQVWLFLTYNSEEKAYPFSDWPSGEGEALAEPVSETTVTGSGQPPSGGSSLDESRASAFEEIDAELLDASESNLAPNSQTDKAAVSEPEIAEVYDAAVTDAKGADFEPSVPAAETESVLEAEVSEANLKKERSMTSASDAPVLEDGKV